jgi:uncharacterized protein (DUF952 family)
LILHILRRADWHRAVSLGLYTPESLDTEGFVHCSTAAQVAQTAERFFRGQPDLLLLCIDDQRLSAPVEFEGPANSLPGSDNELFPHVYGPINLDAVANVIDFPCGTDGSFQLPQSLKVRVGLP